MRAFNPDHHDPHATLGLHETRKGKVIRLWRPGASKIHLEFQGSIVDAQCVHQDGLFEYPVSTAIQATDYRIYHRDGTLAFDPYAFLPTIGDVDQYLFGRGVHYQAYNLMGARLGTYHGVVGVRFVVWAPAAQRVSVVGDFNHWDGRVNPMRSMGQSGLWELFVPGLKEGERYKFEIKTQTGELRVKADPYALSSEVRPATASVVANVTRFEWQDSEYLEQRLEQRHLARPINTYEVHLGSWRRQDGNFLGYRELAHQLGDYCSELGYTHIELLPISEHPLDESWGYQVSGFYAVTSRFGKPEDFQYFVNHLHKLGIGIVLDWVPGHFPTDDFSLARFDGTCLYEHEDPRKGFHPHWSTNIFNFGRHEVTNFLLANALFWCDVMHIDGLRVDAVASMLYLDYGREPGEWIPNPYGGKENLEAIEFLKHLNSIVHDRHPGVLTIAEESTSFTGVTHPVEGGGLGFDLKWNMGWMNDTLRYISKDPIYRSHHHNDLTFGLLYAFTERFCLVFSHDEVVHGKKALLSKMPGDMWQQFANLRLLLSYMMCQPGKKLLFMGCEIGQWNEWNCKEALDWMLLYFETHRGIQTMVKELNHFYLQSQALWERDFDYHGFEWVDFSDHQNSVISYLRKSANEQLLCIHNFTPAYFPEYIVQLHNVKEISEVFNSDATTYGGSGKVNLGVEIISPYAVRIRLAPLATMIFKVVRK